MEFLGCIHTLKHLFVLKTKEADILVILLFSRKQEPRYLKDLTIIWWLSICFNSSAPRRAHSTEVEDSDERHLCQDQVQQFFGKIRPLGERIGSCVWHVFLKKVPNPVRLATNFKGRATMYSAQHRLADFPVKQWRIQMDKAFLKYKIWKNKMAFKCFEIWINRSLQNCSNQNTRQKQKIISRTFATLQMSFPTAF